MKKMNSLFDSCRNRSLLGFLLFIHRNLEEAIKTYNTMEPDSIYMVNTAGELELNFKDEIPLIIVGVAPKSKWKDSREYDLLFSAYRKSQ